MKGETFGLSLEMTIIDRILLEWRISRRIERRNTRGYLKGNLTRDRWRSQRGRRERKTFDQEMPEVSRADLAFSGRDVDRGR